jgi:putative Mg2+ transporter-C (MgtC) family protein
MLDTLTAFYTADIGIDVVALRLAAAAVLGLVIGLDREFREVPAGLRTHMLVSLAAATFAILAFEIVARATAEGVSNPDPVRIIEAVTAGVAFLAAGTIIRGGGRVHGLTTGAAMWLAGAVGLACGVGAFSVALVATVFGMTILTAIRWAERAASLKPKGGDRRSQD